MPLALLEHWFEQINRFVGLDFFADNHPIALDFFLDDDTEDLGSEKQQQQRRRQEGIVYLDGLGDIVDVKVVVVFVVIF